MCIFTPVVSLFVLHADPTRTCRSFPVLFAGNFNMLRFRGAPWSPRSHHSSAVLNDRLVIAGGILGDSSASTVPWISAPLNVNTLSTSQGLHWEMLDPAKPFFPVGRFVGASMVVLSAPASATSLRLMVIGGGDGHTPSRDIRWVDYDRNRRGKCIV